VIERVPDNPPGLAERILLDQSKSWRRVVEVVRDPQAGHLGRQIESIGVVWVDTAATDAVEVIDARPGEAAITRAIEPPVQSARRAFFLMAKYRNVPSVLATVMRIKHDIARPKVHQGMGAIFPSRSVGRQVEDARHSTHGH